MNLDFRDSFIKLWISLVILWLTAGFCSIHLWPVLASCPPNPITQCVLTLYPLSTLIASCSVYLPLSHLSYLAARLSFLCLRWDRCQKHPFDLFSPGVSPNFRPISSLFRGYLLWRCLGALPCAGMLVLVAQAVVATGGVKDVGLELGAHRLITGEGHGDSARSLHPLRNTRSKGGIRQKL